MLYDEWSSIIRWMDRLRLASSTRLLKKRDWSRLKERECRRGRGREKKERKKASDGKAGTAGVRVPDQHGRRVGGVSAHGRHPRRRPRPHHRLHPSQRPKPGDPTRPPATLTWHDFFRPIALPKISAIRTSVEDYPLAWTDLGCSCFHEMNGTWDRSSSSGIYGLELEQVNVVWRCHSLRTTVRLRCVISEI